MEQMLPDNARFMYAAYVIVGLAYFGYALVLWRRNTHIKKRLRELSFSDSSHLE